MSNKVEEYGKQIKALDSEVRGRRDEIIRSKAKEEAIQNSIEEENRKLKTLGVDDPKKLPEILKALDQEIADDIKAGTQFLKKWESEIGVGKANK